MSKKNKITATSMALLFLGNVAFAHAIPGITEPYDPPNYYSPTNVSIPDSAPSPFTLMDLERQGYQVHDVTNNKKDIVSGIQAYTEYLNVAKLYLMQLSNLFHMENNNLDSHLNNMKEQVYDLSSFSEVSKTRDIDKYLFNYEKSVTQDQDIPLEDKYNYLHNLYETALVTAKSEAMKNKDKENALNATIEALISASSEMQGREALSVMEAIKQLELLKQQQLINQLTAVKVASIKDRLDEDYRLQRSNLRFFNLKIEDPYNPSEYYKTHYKKEQAKGFVDFE